MGGGSIIHLVLPIFKRHTECIRNAFKIHRIELNCEITAVSVVTKQNVCVSQRVRDEWAHEKETNFERDRNRKKKAACKMLYKYNSGNQTHRWIHLHSVLRLNSNNTTNFIFIANKTNFYRHLAAVCSFEWTERNISCGSLSISLDFILFPSVFIVCDSNKCLWLYWHAYF